MNGTDVLLYVDNGFGTLIAVASQRAVDFKEAIAPIDVSSKVSRNRRIIAGRYSADVTLSNLYIPTSSGYGRLKDAMRNGTAIVVGRYEGGSKLEQASAIVASLDGNFPDQGAGIVSIQLAVDGAWA
jgi:predicted secreted protein